MSFVLVKQTERVIPLLPLDAALGRPFPVSDNLSPTESGNGYALRMAVKNGISYGSLVTLVASVGHRYLPFSASKYVAYLFGADPLRFMFAVPERLKEGGHIQIRFMGHFFRRPYLIRRNAFPQFCPLCLEESEFAFSFWEVSLATACPTHGIRLLERCAECGNLVSWRRPSLVSCQCGADMRSAKASEASDTELVFSQIIQERLTGIRVDGGKSTALYGERVFSQLTLDVLLRLVWCAGIQSAMPDRKIVPGTATRVPSCEMASQIVNVGLDGILRASAIASVDLLTIVDGDSRTSLAGERPTLWTGSGLAEDLNLEEIQMVEILFPGFSAKCGGAEMINRQLALMFTSTGFSGAAS